MSERVKNCKYRSGETHPGANATDDDVAMAVELVEKYGLSSRAVGEKFGVAASTVRGWVAGRRRGVTRSVA